MKLDHGLDHILQDSFQILLNYRKNTKKTWNYKKWVKYKIDEQKIESHMSHAYENHVSTIICPSALYLVKQALFINIFNPFT